MLFGFCLRLGSSPCFSPITSSLVSEVIPADSSIELSRSLCWVFSLSSAYF
jgi:hypothetical protein